jgi:hypothetical protein
MAPLSAKSVTLATTPALADSDASNTFGPEILNLNTILSQKFEVLQINCQLFRGVKSQISTPTSCVFSIENKKIFKIFKK